MDHIIDLRGCLEGELQDVVHKLGLKPYRARQVFQWVQRHAVQRIEEMANISHADKEVLKQAAVLTPLSCLQTQISKDGTRKYLFGFPDGETVESVLMDYRRQTTRDRSTVCLSTQVGCPVGCAFCATGRDGFRRNLTAGEIVGQVLDITHFMRREDPDFHVTNVVFMGMGEPLLNLEQVFKAIDILNSEHGQNIGKRRMTVSTSGIVPGILEMARRQPQVGLAVSLHAATDEMRDVLVPVNRRYPLAELMAACREYTAITNRRITFEIALTKETSSQAVARDFVRLLKGQLAHVNLIPVNPVEGAGMVRPHPEEIKRFADILLGAGIPVSIREERGTDINAACGQLRRRWKGEGR